MLFKPGDIVRFKDKNCTNAKYFKHGISNLEIFAIRSPSTYHVYESDKSKYFAVVQDELELDSHHHPFAFYKRSSEPWTQEECDTIAVYTNDQPYTYEDCKDIYIYHDGSIDYTRYYPWSDQNL